MPNHENPALQDSSDLTDLIQMGAGDQGANIPLLLRSVKPGVPLRVDRCVGLRGNRQLQNHLLRFFTDFPNGRKLLILLVGAGRFERPTPCAQGRCATRLRYAPTFYASMILNHFQDFRYCHAAQIGPKSLRPWQTRDKTLLVPRESNKSRPCKLNLFSSGASPNRTCKESLHSRQCRSRDIAVNIPSTWRFSR